MTMTYQPMIAVSWVDGRKSLTEIIGTCETITQANCASYEIGGCKTYGDFFDLCNKYNFKVPQKLQSKSQTSKALITPYVI